MNTRTAKNTFAAVLALAMLVVRSEAQLQKVSATPYDRQMTPVRAILENTPQGSGQWSMSEVNFYMRNLRAIPYQYSTNWKTPEQVQTEFKADCKAKAVALYSILKKRGAENLRLVIGMRTKKSPTTHAWLEMEQNGKTYLLDPTYFDRVRTIDPVKRNDYVQMFAYEGDKKYRI